MIERRAHITPPEPPGPDINPPSSPDETPPINDPKPEPIDPPVRDPSPDERPNPKRY
jgi:hypothetical protein